MQDEPVAHVIAQLPAIVPWQNTDGTSEDAARAATASSIADGFGRQLGGAAHVAVMRFVAVAAALATQGLARPPVMGSHDGGSTWSELNTGCWTTLAGTLVQHLASHFSTLAAYAPRARAV